ncbi:MAG TPA: cystathionine beta-lyase [Candidatus Angelobacter sp.]
MPNDWKTGLIHFKGEIPEGFRSLVTPVYRGSTVVFHDVASATDEWDQHEFGYTYGLYGTPTTLELAARICDLEKGFRTIITAGGQGAISLIYLSLLKSGDHVLLPESIYGPNRKFTNDVLRRFSVEASYYPPAIGPGISALLRLNTRVVWCESPGSITMEVQDVPAIAEQVHRHGALVVMDNTWSSGVYFDAFAHGIDVTMQALTKYVGGHSDLLLGSVTVRDPALYESFGQTYQVLGCSPSPDDCSLALRGMKTLAIRLRAIEQSALDLAQWIQQRPEIQLVLHPALPSCPGHDLWKRDFTGSSGLFSVVFLERFTREQVVRFVNALQLFKIGYSWGGVTSLVMAYEMNSPNRPVYGSRIVRLYVGLESPDDLRADMAQALEAMK